MADDAVVLSVKITVAEKYRNRAEAMIRTGLEAMQSAIADLKIEVRHAEPELHGVSGKKDGRKRRG